MSYLEQDKCYVINVRNLKLKVTKTQHCKLLNLKVLKVESFRKFISMLKLVAYHLKDSRVPPVVPQIQNREKFQ